MNVKDLASNAECPFSIDNIPFGIISTSSDLAPRCATAIGDFAVDLVKYAQGADLAALKLDPRIFANVRLVIIHMSPICRRGIVDILYLVYTKCVRTASASNTNCFPPEDSRRYQARCYRR